MTFCLQKYFIMYKHCKKNQSLYKCQNGLMKFFHIFYLKCKVPFSVMSISISFIVVFSIKSLNFNSILWSLLKRANYFNNPCPCFLNNPSIYLAIYFSILKKSIFSFSKENDHLKFNIRLATRRPQSPWI